MAPGTFLFPAVSFISAGPGRGPEQTHPTRVVFPFVPAASIFFPARSPCAVRLHLGRPRAPQVPLCQPLLRTLRRGPGEGNPALRPLRPQGGLIKRRASHHARSPARITGTVCQGRDEILRCIDAFRELSSFGLPSLALRFCDLCVVDDGLHQCSCGGGFVGLSLLGE